MGLGSPAPGSPPSAPPPPRVGGGIISRDSGTAEVVERRELRRTGTALLAGAPRPRPRTGGAPRRPAESGRGVLSNSSVIGAPPVEMAGGAPPLAGRLGRVRGRGRVWVGVRVRVSG